MIKTKKLIASGLFCGALLMGSVGGAFAGPDHILPGMPGDANCQGQTAAYLAQAAKNGLLPEEFRGLGGVSRASGFSIQQIQQVVEAFCNQQP